MTQIRLDPRSVSWREVDGEILALDVVSSTYLGTNGVGALLWKALAVGTSRDRLVSLLLSEYDVGEIQAANDVDEFLSDLAAQGLLAA